jgi:hypothetical protein
MVQEVRSPISSTTRGSKLASAQPLSPGARSHPSAHGRSDQASAEHPAEPTQARVSLGDEEGATVHVTGPEQRTDRRRDSTPQGEPTERRSSVSDRTQDGPINEPPPPPED